jgi:hypothetical protein
MFSEDMPKIVSRMFTIVESVEAALGTTCVLEKKSSQGELALFFKDCRGDHVFYFAFRYDLWMRLQSPLWFGVHTTWKPEIVAAFTSGNTGRYVDHDNFRLCPIDHDIILRENPSDSILTILKQQITALPCTG